MAFVIAAIIAVISLAIGLLGIFASGMSDASDQSSGVAPIVIGGLALSALIAVSHWLPHIGW